MANLWRMKTHGSNVWSLGAILIRRIQAIKRVKLTVRKFSWEKIAKHKSSFDRWALILITFLFFLLSSVDSIIGKGLNLYLSKIQILFNFLT